MRVGQTAGNSGAYTFPIFETVAMGVLFIVLSLTTFNVAFAGEAAALRSIAVQGSTTFHSRIIQPNLSRIEAASGIKLNVVPNKSLWGLIALYERRAELAMVSADLLGEVTKAQKTAPKISFAELRQFEIARVSLAFIVHPSNPVKTITHEQLRGIFSGQITNWKDIGGADLPIRVVATHSGGGTVMTLSTQLLDGADITAPNAARLENARHVVSVVEQLPGAIGVAQAGLATKAKVALLDAGVPIEQLLNYVTLGDPSADVQAVIDATRDAVAQNPL